VVRLALGPRGEPLVFVVLELTGGAPTNSSRCVVGERANRSARTQLCSRSCVC